MTVTKFEADPLLVHCIPIPHQDHARIHQESTVTIINSYSTPQTTPAHSPTAAEPPSPIHTSYYERQIADEQKRNSASSSTDLTTVEEANTSGEPEKKDENPKKVYRPWFIWTVTLAQTISLIWSFGLNMTRTGSLIQTGDNFNYFIGPANGVSKENVRSYGPSVMSQSVLNGQHV